MLHSLVERMESMTQASLNGYAVTARIESGHGRVYGMEYGLVRFAKLLRPCPNNLLNTIHSSAYSIPNSIHTVRESSFVAKLVERSSMVSSMESMTWACSLRETATPVPCQATHHYSNSILNCAN